MKTRKQYTKEFKEDAIRLILEHGYKQTEAARRLGVERRMLARWSKASQCEGGEAFPGNGKLNAEQQQRRRLREETRRLRMERAILKKATAFFARESS
jgi:transposase